MRGCAHSGCLFLSYPSRNRSYGSSEQPACHQRSVSQRQGIYYRRWLGHRGQDKMIFRTPPAMFILDQSPG